MKILPPFSILRNIRESDMLKLQSGVAMLAAANLLFTTAALAQQTSQQSEAQSQQHRKLSSGHYRTSEGIEPVSTFGQTTGTSSAVSSQPCAPDARPWQLVTKENGLQIFSQDIPGSQYKAFKGTLTVQASLDKAISLLINPSKCDELYKRCRRSEILDSASKNEKYVYVTYNIPWPYQDRDAVVHATSSRNTDQKTFTLRYVGKPDYIPKKSGFVRIPELRTSWMLEEKKENELRVTYQTYSDPGGNLIPSLANSSNKKSTMKTLRKIRSLLTP
jgi:hypothetical protein